MKNLTLLAALSTAFCSNTFASCVDHIVDDLLKKPTTHELFDPAISNKAVRDLFDANYSSQNSEAVIKKINEITGGSITVNPSDKTMSIDGSKVELIWVDKASKLRITKAANKVCTNAQGAQHLMKLMAYWLHILIYKNTNNSAAFV